MISTRAGQPVSVTVILNRDPFAHVIDAELTVGTAAPGVPFNDSGQVADQHFRDPQAGQLLTLRFAAPDRGAYQVLFNETVALGEAGNCDASPSPALITTSQGSTQVLQLRVR